MTTWETLNVFRDILIQYYFGNVAMFYIGIVVLFILALSLDGLEFRLVLVFSIPLIVGLAADGLLGTANGFKEVALLIVAIIYAFAIMELMT